MVSCVPQPSGESSGVWGAELNQDPERARKRSRAVTGFQSKFSPTMQLSVGDSTVGADGPAKSASSAERENGLDVGVCSDDVRANDVSA